MRYTSQYSSIVPTETLRVTQLYTIHYFENYKNYFFPGERHPFWELVYIDRGEIIVETDQIEQPVHLAQGDLILHRPNEFHRFYANSITPHNLFIISFNTLSPAMQYFYCHPLFRTQPKVIAQISQIIAEAKRCFSVLLQDPNAEMLTRREDAPLGGEQIITMMLELLLIQLCRGENVRSEEDERRGKQEKLSEGYVESIIDYLKHNLQTTITLADVSAYVGVSRSQLSKMFLRSTGKSVMQYLRELRIEEAKFMIRRQNANFTEIAHQLGYSSIHHFSRQFKDITGMSPTEYATSIRILTESTEFTPLPSTRATREHDLEP